MFLIKSSGTSFITQFCKPPSQTTYKSSSETYFENYLQNLKDCTGAFKSYISSSLKQNKDTADVINCYAFPLLYSVIPRLKCDMLQVPYLGAP